MIKGLLHSNTNTTAIDLNASLSQALTIHDNYHYPVIEGGVGWGGGFLSEQGWGVHRDVTLANLLQMELGGKRELSPLISVTMP